MEKSIKLKNNFECGEFRVVLEMLSFYFTYFWVVFAE